MSCTKSGCLTDMAVRRIRARRAIFPLSVEPASGVGLSESCRGACRYRRQASVPKIIRPRFASRQLERSTMKRLLVAILASVLMFGACAGAQERLEPAAKDATVFGYKLHYLEAGRGEPIILLHGSGGEGARWMPTIQGLAANFRVIAIDQTGFGH